jgi:hypothetical protein
MISMLRSAGTPVFKTATLAAGFLASFGPFAMGYEPDLGNNVTEDLVTTYASSGFQGFGLCYHLGYGYGGDAFGVTPNGGYPFYGGPGYPHPAPCLRRFGHIAPFSYFGGPGYPSPEHPHFFGGVGPLVVDQPVATFTEPRDIDHARGAPVYPYNVGFGPYTGARPYPETLFAPYASGEASTGASVEDGSPAPVTPSTPAASNARQGSERKKLTRTWTPSGRR